MNPVGNLWNSTINTLGTSTSYGLDLDTFDVSSHVAARDTLATATFSTGPDLVILNTVLLQVKSNIITGRCSRMSTTEAAPDATWPQLRPPRPVYGHAAGSDRELYDRLET